MEFTQDSILEKYCTIGQTSNVDNTNKACVYLTVNTITNKIYVGVSSKISNVVDGSYKGSGLHLRRSIEKHGWGAFDSIILLSFSNINHAYVIEKRIVSQAFVESKATYNLKCGGSGGWSWSKEIKEKASAKSIKTAKKNRALGLHKIPAFSIIGSIANTEFKKTQKKAHNTQKAKRNHAKAAAKNWESLEYRSKIPKRTKGFTVLYKDNVYMHVYDDAQITAKLKDGWLKRGPKHTQDTKLKIAKSTKTAMTSFFENPKNNARWSNIRTKMWSDEETRKSIVNKRKDAAIIRKIYRLQLLDKSKISENIILCNESIRLLCKSGFHLKFSKINASNIARHILLNYSELDLNVVINNEIKEFVILCKYIWLSCNDMQCTQPINFYDRISNLQLTN